MWSFPQLIIRKNPCSYRHGCNDTKLISTHKMVCFMNLELELQYFVLSYAFEEYILHMSIFLEHMQYSSAWPRALLICIFLENMQLPSAWPLALLICLGTTCPLWHTAKHDAHTSILQSRHCLTKAPSFLHLMNLNSCNAPSKFIEK